MALSITDYHNELLTQRAERAQQLLGDRSWLTLAGLFWLHAGKNTVGAAPQHAVVLAARAGIHGNDVGAGAEGDDGRVAQRCGNQQGDCSEAATPAQAHIGSGLIENDKPALAKLFHGDSPVSSTQKHLISLA